MCRCRRMSRCRCGSIGGCVRWGVRRGVGLGIGGRVGCGIRGNGRRSCCSCRCSGIGDGGGEWVTLRWVNSLYRHTVYRGCRAKCCVCRRIG